MRVVLWLIIITFIGIIKSVAATHPAGAVYGGKNYPDEDEDIIPELAGIGQHSSVADEKNINCDEFPAYALNCTAHAAVIYNSTRKAPPMPAKIGDWCAAIRHITRCANEWNNECRYVTNSHFNEESIRGHNYVIRRICDDDRYLQQYDESQTCIKSVASVWEDCYQYFGLTVDGLKMNATREWTHYETHFFLCCSKAKFRRCTFDALFKVGSNCTKNHAVTLQRFSVIISEGDVFQDCDFNMVYTNCPGGDPRPASLRAMVNMKIAEDLGEHSAAILLVFDPVVIFTALLCVLGFL